MFLIGNLGLCRSGSARNAGCLCRLRIGGGVFHGPVVMRLPANGAGRWPSLTLVCNATNDASRAVLVATAHGRPLDPRVATEQRPPFERLVRFVQEVCNGSAEHAITKNARFSRSMKLYLDDSMAVIVIERKLPLKRPDAERLVARHAVMWRLCTQLALLLRRGRLDADAQQHLEQHGWHIFRYSDDADQIVPLTKILPIPADVSISPRRSAEQETLAEHFARLPDQRFQLVAPYTPAADQPAAIQCLVDRLPSKRFQVLKGATGTGKTFVIANVIAQYGRPTLVLAPNKTLAAQLYRELRGFFPSNAVEFFVSYYDFYLPEAYNSATDTYIEKSASINKDIDRYRHAATRALFERPDVIIVSSVSCIYGLGMPSTYLRAATSLKLGDVCSLDEIVLQLEAMLYERRADPRDPGTFRIRDTAVEVSLPSWDERELLLRIDVQDHQIVELRYVDRETGADVEHSSHVTLYPARHFVTPEEERERALQAIAAELQSRCKRLRERGQHHAAERLERRTTQDLELLREHGYCSGIENYAMHLSGRAPDVPPECLLDYFPPEWLLIIDESHVMVPQIRGMYHGDRARKENLVRYGFRLPSALENRPLRESEFWTKVHRCVFVSATPGPFELCLADGALAELLIRPTHVLDPRIQVHPTRGQIEHLTASLRQRVQRGEKALITTLTKRMAEELCRYLREQRFRVSYLHSELNALERVEVLSALGTESCDVIVGVNLLREGLDLPQVSLVAILDADKEGFLRSETALIQTMGRAARHVAGTVTLYADTLTDSMQRAISETERRRAIQAAYNAKYGMEPRSILAKHEPYLKREKTSSKMGLGGRLPAGLGALDDEQLRTHMHEAAAQLDFELAAVIRDLLEKRELSRLEARLQAQHLTEDSTANASRHRRGESV